MTDGPAYGIADLAELGAVSRRTVRYYVQEGLLPAPRGVGRGNHYGPEHLDQLLKVKALQENGRTLEEIRRILREGTGRLREPAAPPVLPRSSHRRVALMPGVELHIAASVRLPAEHRLQELATWCRVHFRNSDEDSDA